MASSSSCEQMAPRLSFEQMALTSPRSSFEQRASTSSETSRTIGFNQVVRLRVSNKWLQGFKQMAPSSSCEQMAPRSSFEQMASTNPRSFEQRASTSPSFLYHDGPASGPEISKNKKLRAVQYVRFPGGPPPEYWTRLWLLSFGDRTGSGVSNQV